MDQKQTQANSPESGTPNPDRTTIALTRRGLLKLLPAAGVAGLAVKLPLTTLAQSAVTPSPSPAQSPSPSPAPTPQKITKEMLQQTEKVIGIELTDAQETMAL